MRREMLDFLRESTGALTFEDILLNFIVASVIGVIIYASYRLSHTGAVYSAHFNVSLIMLTLTTTLVMNVIGNNIALSLGMVGALSIVRFRTAIKDPRDTTYIFWCIASGICCGVSEYLIAGIGSAVIFFFMLVFGAVKSNDRFLLIIRGTRVSESPIDLTVRQFYGKKATLKVRSSNEDSLECIYELSWRVVYDALNKKGLVSDALHKLDGVTYVSLVSQNDEINR